MQQIDDTLIGTTPELTAVMRAAQLVAVTDAPVLIQGESGTGKELLAETVHRHSRRQQRPLVRVNCAALPETLAETLLYGHRKGAFTGAIADQTGYIQQADGGTLLLDEVCELPLTIQAKLLRFLESGEYQVIGEGRVTHANVRIIAASNRDLAAEVAAGRFRQDLFFRLNVVPLTLPPLRTRSSDIPQLIAHFTETLAQRYGLEAPRYSSRSLQRLRDHAWPGNVRELRNLCERLLILFSGRDIEPENLPAEIRTTGCHPATGGVQLPSAGLRLDELEVELIRQALHKTGGNRTHAARLLGLTRDTLLYRLKKYALV